MFSKIIGLLFFNSLVQLALQNTEIFSARNLAKISLHTTGEEMVNIIRKKTSIYQFGFKNPLPFGQCCCRKRTKYKDIITRITNWTGDAILPSYFYLKGLKYFGDYSFVPPKHFQLCENSIWLHTSFPKAPFLITTLWHLYRIWCY